MTVELALSNILLGLQADYTSEEFAEAVAAAEDVLRALRASYLANEERRDVVNTTSEDQQIDFVSAFIATLVVGRAL